MILNFIKPDRIISMNTDVHKVAKDAFYHGQVCGTSRNRVHQPKRVKYTLRKELTSPPSHYGHLYSQKDLTSTQLGSEGGKSVKKIGSVWYLNKNHYFSWHKLPDMLQNSNNLIEVKGLTAKRLKDVPWDQRPVKPFSIRTAKKIESKLRMWWLDEYFKNGKNLDRVNFKFATFTVTKRDFSHELTVKAWQNFLDNLKKMHGHKFQYLWVAELQSGSRNIEIANKYLEMSKIGGSVGAGYREKYNEWISKIPTNNIHYHVVFDRFYDIKILNKLWLTCLSNVGAPTHGTSGEQLQPVQIVPVKSGFNQLSRYVAKYCTKGDSQLRCALWHCSRKISRFATSVLHVTSELVERAENQIKTQNELKQKERVGGSLSRNLLRSPLLTLCSIDNKPIHSENAPKNDSKGVKIGIKKLSGVEGLTVYLFSKMPHWLYEALIPLLRYNAVSSSPLPFRKSCKLDVFEAHRFGILANCDNFVPAPYSAINQ